MYRLLVTPLLAIRPCSVVYVVYTSFRLRWYWTFLLLGPADRAKCLCHGPLTVGRTPTGALPDHLTCTKCIECTEQSCVGVRPHVHLRNLLTRFEEIWGKIPGWNFVSYRLCITLIKRETQIDVYRFFQLRFFFWQSNGTCYGIQISLTSVCLNRRSC